jgi:Mg-chelatase subunit ChlD
MYRPRRRSFVPRILAIVLAVIVIRTFLSDNRREDDDNDGGEQVAAIDRELAPPADAQGAMPREGIAAVVLMDVSGSMKEVIDRQTGPKIGIARRAALDLVRQFDAYAVAHPDEPVLLGLFEFSGRSGESTREIIPLSKPDPVRAEQALAKMFADGGTPIGDAMIVGKRALDRTGLTRRHLLVVTDGENTDGHAPDTVMAALMRRPETERPSVYFVAFDIAASRFNAVRDGGGLVLAAADAKELNETLDTLLSGKILVEQ